ncbi:MAG: PAS domain S-box protein [Alphaproteobacteria bacterium]|nr:PAS domain S-box protein [Alphaproteobacteria bacterium]
MADEEELRARIRTLEAEVANLRRDLARVEAVIENAPIGLAITDLEEGFTRPNLALEAFLGRQGGFAESEIPEFTHPSDGALHVDMFAEMRRGERDGFTLEKRYVRPDGEIRWGLVSVVQRNDAAGAYQVASVQDITELKRNKQMLRTLFELLPVSVGITHVETGRILYANPALASLVGADVDALLGSTTELLYEPGERERVLATAREEGQVDGLEVWLRDPTGRRVRARLHVRPIELDEGLCYLGTAIDVTREHAAVQHFWTIAEATPSAVAVVSLARREYVYVNASFAKFTGFPAEQLMGRPIANLMEDADLNERLLTDAVNGVLPAEPIEITLQMPDGRSVVALTETVFVELDGEPCVLVVVVDVTAKRAMEKALVASIEEKDLLLREVHHRVKNNLQVVSSLLFLQSAPYRGTDAGDAFDACRQRVVTMAAVHEALYAHGDLASVSIGRLLAHLGDMLEAAYVRPNAGVSIVVEADDANLSLDLAVPCSLVANELITNALKHAFPDRPGRVRVGLSRTDEEWTLVVEDDGIGWTKKPDASSSLGLRVVSALTGQLRGGLTIDAPADGTGTRIEVRFPTAPE